MIDVVDVSTITTDDAVLDFMRRWLTERHLHTEGGYPYDSLWIGDQLIVASLSHDGETTIDVYERGHLLSWFYRALREVEEYDDIFYALWENAGEVFDVAVG
jgi:TorA maturation chaperone TorD